MKTSLVLISGCLVGSTLLAQPAPKPIATFQSPATRLNTTALFPVATTTSGGSRIDWLSDMEADQTVSSPTFIVKACITSPKPVSRYTLFLNDRLQIANRDLSVNKDKGSDCAQPFNQTLQLVEGENRLKLVAYLTGGGEISAPLTVTYKKPAIRSLEKRLALVIGNADYPGANKLSNPANDATDIAAVLRKLGFEVMVYTNLTNRSMKEAINTFGDKLRDYQVGLFYYAGHGVQSKGINYLVPLDAKPETENEIEYDCLQADRIMTKMEDARTRTNIIVLDACRDNPLGRSLRGMSRGGGDNGLATMDAPAGSIIAYSTAPGHTAADGGGRNGLYTGALLKALQAPNQNITQLFQQVRKEVRQLSADKQTPWESTSLTDDFYFQPQKK